MKRFNIKPYIHVVQIMHIYMGGKIYGPEILKINDEYIKNKCFSAIKNIASFSLATGVPTKASAVHSIKNGLEKLLGLKMHTKLDCPGLVGGAGAGAVAVQVAVAASDKKDAKAGKGKKKEPEPEPEDEGDDDLGGGMGDLFG
jgi:hypothetical protein